MPDFDIQDFDQVLIVEGYSDLLFYAEVLEIIGKSGRVFIKHFNGKGDIEKHLQLFLTPVVLSEKNRIGIIVDADERPGNTFTRLQSALQTITAQNISRSGTWTLGKPDVGVLIVPSDSIHGEIETLVWDSWAKDPANAAAKDCVERFAECMSNAGHTARSAGKGLINSILAVRNDDDPRLGPGARCKVFDLTRPELENVRTFLNAFD